MDAVFFYTFIYKFIYNNLVITFMYRTFMPYLNTTRNHENNNFF